MKDYLFKIFEKVSEKKALKELIAAGLEDYFTINEGEKRWIGGKLRTFPKKLHFSKFEKELGMIDWEEQAKAFSPYYKAGRIEIPLRDFGFDKDEVIFLHPGEGFGDLSHQTTKLMLESMAVHVNNHRATDIGSGSGILALACQKALNSCAIGIEICPQALQLSKKNAIANNLSPEMFKPSNDLLISILSSNCVLINMIFSEQKIVLELLKNLNFNGLWISSGLKSDEINSYMESLPFKNCQILEIREKDDWVALTIHIESSCNQLQY